NLVATEPGIARVPFPERTKLDRVLQAEAKLDMEPLRQAALSQAVEKIFKHTAAQAFAATKFVGRQDTRT
ncbi:hypothetical protein HUU05_25710, partial [candidate division KSB1 bacterium]|nr:hypothetical protein [candidate division KSB1 bacterium]